MDVLRADGPLGALCERVARADRLVLLGDTLELRHGPARDVLAAAEPVLAALGAALGEGKPIVVVPGNHDHGIVSEWLRGRELGLSEAPPKSASDISARLVKLVGPAQLSFAYPGVWLREDVYATHGHYLDRLSTLPSIERIVAGLMSRVVGDVPGQATPNDFEAALAPVYAWMRSVAEGHGGTWAQEGSHASASAWQTLSGRGRPTLKARAARAGFPVGVAALNAAGAGPLRPSLGGAELRRSSLRAISDVVRRLGIDAAHVVFGHTHRAGPLPGDHAHEWQAATGAHLHNPGCWTVERKFVGDAGPESPYYAGRALEVDDAPGSVPRLVRVTRDLA